MSNNSFAELLLSYLFHSTLCFGLVLAIQARLSSQARTWTWRLAAVMGCLGAWLPWLAQGPLLLNPFGFTPWLLNRSYHSSISPSWDLSFCLATLLCWTWLLGFCGHAIRLVYSAVRARCRLAGRTPVLDPNIIEVANRCRLMLGFATPLRLTQCTTLQSAVALGTREVCLSRDALEQLSENELTAVLGHEIAHLQRRDPLRLPLLEAARCVFWFQPLWRLYLEHRDERVEALCDAIGARLCKNPGTMARVIVKLAQPTPRHQLALVGLGNQRGPLSRRVALLVDPDRCQTPRPLWLPLLGAAAMILFLLGSPRITMDIPDRLDCASQDHRATVNRQGVQFPRT